MHDAFDDYDYLTWKRHLNHIDRLMLDIGNRPVSMVIHSKALDYSHDSYYVDDAIDGHNDDTVDAIDSI